MTPPDLHDIEWTIWQAFGELHTTRHEAGPIPWTAMQQYAEQETGIMKEVFVKIIRAMDDAFVSHHAGKSSKKFSKELMRGQ